MSENTCDLNYKAEYERLMSELEKAKCEISHWRETARKAEQENISLRAKMEVVELIFGRRGWP